MSGRRAQAGVALVELAMVLLPLVGLAVAVLELTRMTRQYELLTQRVRDGARYLSARPLVAAADIDRAVCIVRTASADCRRGNVLDALAGLAPVQTTAPTPSQTTAPRLHVHVPTELVAITLSDGTTANVGYVRVTLTGVAYALMPAFAMVVPDAADFMFPPITVTFRMQ